MKNKQTIFKFVKAAIIFIIFFSILLVFKDEFKENETYGYGNAEEYNYIELTEGETVTQFLEVKHSMLLNIIFYMDFKEVQEGTLNIQLFDNNGFRVQTFDYELSSLSGSNQIEYPLSTKLKAGNTYSIVFKASDVEEGNEPVLRYVVNDESRNSVIISGNKVPGELNAEYNYVYYNMNLVAPYVLMVMLMAAILLIPSAFMKKVKEKIKYVSICIGLLMPAGAFLMFEMITGNLSDITSSYAIIYNILLFYCLYILIMAITNSVRFTVVFMNTLFFIMACMAYFIESFRGKPIMPSDLYSVSTALSVADQYNFTPNVIMIMSFAVLTLFNLLVMKLPYRIRNLKMRFGYIIFAVCLNLITFNGLLNGGWPSKHGLTQDFWSPSTSYAQNGFLLSTIIQVDYLKVQKPVDYSVAAITESASITEIDYSHEENIEEKITPDNIIVIMNESWADLSVVSDFNTSSEISPFINGLNENTIKGYLHVPVFGGGTANTEYEMLTGNTMAFLPFDSSPYQIYVKPDDYSLVSLMNTLGYSTLAFHPVEGRNWNRNNVYQYFGFDEFFTGEDFTGDYVRGLASDRSDFETLISFYEQKEPGEKLFIFNVTMQNHGGYTNEEFETTVSLIDYPEKYPLAEQYFSLLQMTDSAFEYLVDYFSNVEENTMILMFGDHQPGIEDTFYEQLYGKSLNDLTAEEMQSRYKTPFVFWANYDIEEKTIEGISANYLSTLLMEESGIEMPPYNRFLLELSQTIPVINTIGYIDVMGNHYGWGEESDLDNLLDKYRILQYNNIFDKKNKLQNYFNLVDTINF